MNAPLPLEDGIARLAEGRPWVFRARGQSMRGHIEDGSLVTLHPLHAPRIGPVLLAKRGTHIELHRAVGRRGGQWLLKGDRNLRVTGFERDDLLGRVVRVEHSRGILDLTTPFARLRSILAAGLVWTPLLRAKLRSLF